MVICYIDNKKAYPNTSDKIKVTYGNQFSNVCPGKQGTFQ